MKHYNVILVIFLFSIGIKEQEIKQVFLNLYGGYTLLDKVNYDNSYGYVEDGFEYGIRFEFFLDKKNL